MKPKRYIEEEVKNGSPTNNNGVLDLLVLQDSTVDARTEDFFERTRGKSVEEIKEQFEAKVEANKGFKKKFSKSQE